MAMMLALAAMIAVPAYLIAHYSESAVAQAPVPSTSINYVKEAQAPVQSAQAPIIDSVERLNPGNGSDGILAQPGGSIGAIQLGRAAAATEEPAPIALAASAPTPVSTTGTSGSTGRVITLAELDGFAAQAGWDVGSEDWHRMRRIIAECEDPSLYTASANLNDPYGGSHGLAQLNYNWFERAGESPDQRYDPVVNLRTALWLYHRLGRFGGGGGWSCAATLGID